MVFDGRPWTIMVDHQKPSKTVVTMVDHGRPWSSFRMLLKGLYATCFIYLFIYFFCILNTLRFLPCVTAIFVKTIVIQLKHDGSMSVQKWPLVCTIHIEKMGGSGVEIKVIKMISFNIFPWNHIMWMCIRIASGDSNTHTHHMIN